MKPTIFSSKAATEKHKKFHLKVSRETQIFEILKNSLSEFLIRFSYRKKFFQDFAAMYCENKFISFHFKGNLGFF